MLSWKVSLCEIYFHRNIFLLSCSCIEYRQGRRVAWRQNNGWETTQQFTWTKISLLSLRYSNDQQYSYISINHLHVFILIAYLDLLSTYSFRHARCHSRSCDLNFVRRTKNANEQRRTGKPRAASSASNARATRGSQCRHSPPFLPRWSSSQRVKDRLSAVKCIHNSLMILKKIVWNSTQQWNTFWKKAIFTPVTGVSQAILWSSFSEAPELRSRFRIHCTSSLRDRGLQSGVTTKRPLPFPPTSSDTGWVSIKNRASLCFPTGNM